MLIKKSLNQLINSKDNKTKIVLKNAFFSFFIKGVNISINFLTIPLILSFLNPTQYGIWLTLTAILSWFSLFDLGFGNGLRNHLTKCIANKNYDDGKIFVSTTYAALTVIFGILLVVFLIVNPFINWSSIFNAPDSIQSDLRGAVLYAISLLFVQFILRLINTVLLAFQRSAIADLANSLVQVFILIGLYIVKSMHYNTLTSVAIVYSVLPVFVFLIFNVFLFSKSYQLIRPSIYFVRFKHIKKLLNLGLNFFIIQVSALVLFTSDNFLITQLFKPADVTVYNVAFKYFSIGNILLTMFLSPFWSMATHSFETKDFAWIKNSMKKLKILWVLLIFIGLIQLVCAKVIFKFWTNDSVAVSFSLSTTMLFYFILLNWSAIYSNFLNAVGKIRLQLYFSILAMLINVPLAIFFVKFLHLGILGIPLATMIVMTFGDVLISMQYSKIINFTAKGVWNK